MTDVLIFGLLVLNAVLLVLVWYFWKSAQEKHPQKAEEAPSNASSEPEPPAVKLPELSPEELQRLEQAASTAFEQAVNSATDRFGKSLDETSGRLNQLITRLTTGIVEKELDQYKANVDEARKAALASLSNMQTAVEAQQQTLQAEIDKALIDRRTYLLERLDRRLGEAVSTYLVESLGQAADLGAQRAFLLESLERHKADLKSEFGDET